MGISHESDDSFKAWDKVRSEFLNTLKRLVNLDYENIILISHEDTSKDITKKGGDKITAIKPNLQDKVAMKVAGMVDVVARIVADDANIRDIWVGFNSRHYDQWILKGILCGFDPKKINDYIIIKDNPGWKFSSLLNRIPLINYDVMMNIDRGLKSFEGFMGNSISSRGSADMNRSMRIARTEGHRVQSEAKMDSLHAAKKKGADVVKQWDSTLDSNTRDTHVELDGQVRELDENFTCSGGSAPYPGGFGDPAEDCNCRCCMLQRARWAVKDETTYDKWNNETGGFIECSGYADFKDKYLKAAEQLKIPQKSAILSIADCTDFDSFTKYLGDTYGIQVHDSVKALDFDAVKESMTGIEGVMQEFPQAQATLKSIGTSKSGVMCASFNGNINFNPGYYTKGSPTVRTSMVQGNTTGFHPKNTGVLETGSHEMGHLLERTLIEKANPDSGGLSGLFKAEQWSKCTQAKAVVSDACKAAKKTAEGKGLLNSQLKSDVSRYATKNDSECLAECVADYTANGENASILSKEVWKILKERLG